MNVDQITTVYYNSACPVCDAGICQLRGRMTANKNIDWIDVHTRPEVAAKLGIDLEAIRERLHVMDAHGAMQIGDLALAELATQRSGLQFLSGLIRRLHFVTGPIYNIFARYLYRWNRKRGHW